MSARSGAGAEGGWPKAGRGRRQPQTSPRPLSYEERGDRGISDWVLFRRDLELTYYSTFRRNSAVAESVARPISAMIKPISVMKTPPCAVQLPAATPTRVGCAMMAPTPE